MGALMRTRPQESDDARRHCLLPPPAFHERRHRGLARRRVAVCWGSIFMMPKGERPHPRRSYGRGICLGLHSLEPIVRRQENVIEILRGVVEADLWKFRHSEILSLRSAPAGPPL
jgi:hypothetical protein